MPKSRVRKKAAYVPPPTRSAKKLPSPPWLAPTMSAFFIVGIIWLIVYYVSGGDAPGISWFGGWNLLVGFGFIIVGFALSTQWR